MAVVTLFWTKHRSRAFSTGQRFHQNMLSMADRPSLSCWPSRSASTWFFDWFLTRSTLIFRRSGWKAIKLSFTASARLAPVRRLKEFREPAVPSPVEGPGARAAASEVSAAEPAEPSTMLPWWYAIIVLQFWPMDSPSYLWDFDQPELWQETFPLCDAPLQSPVALTQDRIAFSLPPKVVPGEGLAEGQVTATNTGRRLELRLTPGNASQPSLQLISYKKPLFGVYWLDSIHMHWGDAGGTHGSEHAINDKFSDGEAQFVFYNTFYENISKARRHPGGVAIISVLLRGTAKLAEPSFPTLGLEQHLDSLAARGSEVTFAADLTPVHKQLTSALTKVLAYYGSLTSPPCNPVVTWLVSAEETNVSSQLLYDLATKLFEDRRKLKPLVNNWRPLQDRSGRLITQLENIAP